MLLLAAGRGVRFGGQRPKAWVGCAGQSLVRRCVSRLAALGVSSEIVLAVQAADRQTWLEPELEALRRAGLTRVVDGGATRQQSMRLALAASDPGSELVLVHDAARPLFPLAPAREAIRRAQSVGAALLAVPLPDTLKRVAGDGRVLQTLDRRGLWLAQTPQVARRRLLEEALARAEREGYEGTDEASLLEHAGTRVEVVLGSSHNVKVTTRADLELAEQIAARQDGRGGDDDA